MMDYLSDHGMFVAGLLAAMAAAAARLGDHRRTQRRNLDKVGIMPWTTLFFWSMLIAVALLAASVKARLTGS